MEAGRWRGIWVMLMTFLAILVMRSETEANTRICTHCCDEVYPGEGTPVYYMTQGPKGDTGPEGKRGLDGPRGDKGEAGSKGGPGGPGPPGEKGNVGDPAPLAPQSAFSVARSKELLGNDTTELPLTFDRVFVNLGNHFEEDTGRFICHFPGIYFFSYNVQSYLDKFLGIQLMKNNESQVILYANSVPRRIMQSQSVMLQLRKGDVVWLRQAKGLRFAVYGNPDLQITFSGYLIYPELL